MCLVLRGGGRRPSSDGRKSSSGSAGRASRTSVEAEVWGRSAIGPTGAGHPAVDHRAGPDALSRRARRATPRAGPGASTFPGTRAGRGADPGLIEAIGEDALRCDFPAGIEDIDVGPDPLDTPFQRAQRLAAEAWGARRSWFLVNGASRRQPRRLHGASRTSGERRDRPAQRPLVGDRRARPLRAEAALRRPRARRRARRRPLPDARRRSSEALDRGPGRRSPR